MDEIEKQLDNAAKFTAAKGIKRFTRYLDPAQALLAANAAHRCGISFSCFGGYEDAERAIGCFHLSDEQPQAEDYPLVCLSAQIPVRFCQITHRDLLGAFMALGLTRDCAGDMIIVDDRVYVFVHEQTAAFIADAMTSAGKTPLSFEILSALPSVPRPSGTEFGAVVSSLRLDAVLAAAFRLSRSEAAQSIRAGNVKVNHIQTERIDVIVKEDSLLSLRGKGRVRFVRVSGTTRKERIGITLFRYV